MSDRALCLQCRSPLNDDGLCHSCDSEEAAVAAKLRKLREEIQEERGAQPPSKPKSRLWNEKQKKLLEAKQRSEAEAGKGAEDTPVESESRVAPRPPVAKVRKAKKSPPKTESAPDPGSEKAVGSGSSTTPSSDPEAADPVEESPKGRRGLFGRARVRRAGHSASGMRAREINLSDPKHGSDVIEELLEHRRKGVGKIIGIAGLPRHGKTKLADRLRERYAERPGADLRYDKTERGEVNLYYIPGKREHHVLIDVAGEDFQALGNYERELPGLMKQFLWPVLQELDGLVLMMALPIVWAGWNQPASERRADPAERDEIAMRQARDRMVNSHRMLLKYALVAQNLKRLRRVAPGVDLSSDEVPTRNQVDDAVPSTKKLRTPVAVGFSKADLYAPGDPKSRGSARTEIEGRRSSGLFTPDLPGPGGPKAPPIHPRYTDPLALGHLHFPELFEFMMERVRYFTFDFVQALVDQSASPDPQEAQEALADAGRHSLIGGEGLLEFVTQHPWGVPGLDTASAIRWDRRLNPKRWDRELFRRLHDRRGDKP